MRAQERGQCKIVLCDGYAFKDFELIFGELGVCTVRVLPIDASVRADKYFAGSVEVSGYRYEGVIRRIRERFGAGCFADQQGV